MATYHWPGGKHYSYGYSFIIKGITQEQPNKRKRCIGKVVMGAEVRQAVGRSLGLLLS